LELDDSLAEAHISEGAIAMFYDFDWINAERKFRRGIELNPSYEIGFEQYGYLYVALGKFDEGIRMTKLGIDAAPASVVLSDDLAQAYYLARRYDDASSQAHKSLELDPAHYGVLVVLAQLYEAKGDA
jgi:adenylate cyclase